MITTIDHNKRKRLSLTVIDYIIADSISQYNLSGKAVDHQELADFLGISLANVRQSFNKLMESEPKIMELQPNGFELTDVWYSLDESVKSDKADMQLAIDILHKFNLYNETKYNYHTYATQIQKILKAYKQLTLLHFESVFQHKLETWGKDPNMATYNRPSTLFRNPIKFMQYLDEATRYWSKKSTYEKGIV